MTHVILTRLNPRYLFFFNRFLKKFAITKNNQYQIIFRMIRNDQYFEENQFSCIY